MKNTRYKKNVVVKGDHRPAFSVVLCFVQAGYSVTFLTEDITGAQKEINNLLKDTPNLKTRNGNGDLLMFVQQLSDERVYDIAIAITTEAIDEKNRAIQLLQDRLSEGGILGINTESIPLTNLQTCASKPEKVIGVNWTEPAHTTLFLEIIANKTNNEGDVNAFLEEAKEHLAKDPYVVKGDLSVRARLLSAMVREAFYLVENGYASIPDIDRACRNDAGYYLPFAGNCRYMDLMGTNSYGIVMNDLNPELANDVSTPSFFNKIIEHNGLGMENNKGFYDYKDGKAEEWNALFTKFSHEINELINKYPFNYEHAVPEQ